MTQAGVLKSAWRHRLPVALIIVAFTVAAAMLSLSRTDTFVAEATVVLSDPSQSNVLALNSGESSSRSVANQLEVFRSGLVTSKAAEIAATEGFLVVDRDVVQNTTFTPLRGTDVITVFYTDSDAERAEAMANAIIAAYDEVQLDQRRSSNTSVLERLDASEQLLRSNLGEIQGNIDTILVVRDTEGQIDETLNRVSSVQSQLLQTTIEAGREILLDELAELRIQMESLQLASNIEADSAELAPLLEDRKRLETQLSSIDDRRTELQLESAVEGSGIAFFSPATITEEATGAGNLFSILGGLLLGAMVAVGVAYALGNRRSDFMESTDPETILGAPLLGDIPREPAFGKVALPVRDDARSLVAESFRFAYASMNIRMVNDGYKSVSFASAKVGEGKSTLITNTALAAARTGKRVLLIDADFGAQSSSKLLIKDWRRPGLTDLALGKAHVDGSVAAVPGTDGGGILHVMGRGTVDVTAPDFFANPIVQEVISGMESLYDIVLIDGPPILQVAYASTIAQLTNALVLVIPHESRIRDAEGLFRRVELIGKPVLGYMYNMAPRSSGRQAVHGSMADVLGDGEFSVRASANLPR